MKKTINIKAKESIKLDFVICVSEDKDYVLQTIKKYMNMENNKRFFELSRARIEAENRYLELTGKDINIYQRLLTFLLDNNQKIKNKENSLKNNSNVYSISELWKFGISGDLPIIFIKIKSVNDIDVVEEVVKAYEYLRNKNFQIDLVILNEEKENYDSYVKDAIHNVLLNRNIAYMLNTKGGIYVLNNIKSEDKKLLSIYSNLILDAQNGNLNVQLNEIEEEIPKFDFNEVNEVTEFYEQEKNKNELLNNELKYFNDYGGFSADGKEYLIRVNKEETVPMPWSHILANDNFGTLVTEGMGGYSWYKNSRLNRLTSWSNNAILDIPSEIIYLKDDENKKAWSLGLNPMADNNDYYITYGFGYAKYMHTCLRNNTRR